MEKLIVKCAVNGVLSQGFVGKKLISGLCGSIKVGDKSICGADSNFKCVHKVSRSKTCGNCHHLGVTAGVGATLKIAYCSLDKDERIVPHSAEWVNDQRGNPIKMTFFRIPMWCQREESEVCKSEKTAEKSEYVIKVID